MPIILRSLIVSAYSIISLWLLIRSFTKSTTPLDEDVVGLVMRALGINDGSPDTRPWMVLKKKKKTPAYLDTRARMLMEADPKI